MAVTYYNVSSGDIVPSGTTATTPSFTPTDDRLVFVGMSARWKTPPSNSGTDKIAGTVSDSTTVVEIADEQISSSRHAWVGHMVNSSWSSVTFTFTESFAGGWIDSPSNDNVVYCVIEVDGMTTGGTGGGNGLSNVTTAGATGNPPDWNALTITGTPDAQDETFAIVCSESGIVSVTPDANWSTVLTYFENDGTGGGPEVGLYASNSATADQTPDWDPNTGGDYMAIGMIIEVDAVGGSNSHFLTLLGVG